LRSLRAFALPRFAAIRRLQRAVGELGVRKNMKALSTQLTEIQYRGRTIFISALLFVGILVTKSSISRLYSHYGSPSNHLITIAFWGVILLLSFRGGQLSLKLVKGCAVTFASIMAILFIVISAKLIRGVQLPQAPTWNNSIESIVTLIGVIFSVWALFFSKSVKEFLSHQRKIT
jgi:hypothetical protein